MAKILITGVAGFIGSHLLSHALNLGHEVVGIDNFLTGKPENIDAACDENPDAAQNFVFYREDIRDRDAMIARAKGIDFILHEAAVGSVPWSIDDPWLTHGTNLTGFLNILDAARKNAVKRTVYASSSAVYGSAADVPAREGCEGEALSPYASSKRAQEIYAQSWARAYRMQIIGLRYFNVFGPRQDPNGPYAAVIPRWIQNMTIGKPCAIFGDGTAARDYCHIDNIVSANFLALSAECPGLPQNFALACNIGCGRQTSLIRLHGDMSEIFESLTGKKPLPPVFEPMRQGDVKFSRADISRAKQYINYSPAVSARSGLERLIAEIFESK